MGGPRWVAISKTLPVPSLQPFNTAKADRRRHASQAALSQPEVPPTPQITSPPPQTTSPPLEISPAPQITSPLPEISPAPQITSPPPEIPPTSQTVSAQPEVPPTPQNTSPQPEAPPVPQITLPQPEVPPARLPRVHLFLSAPPAQGEEEPDNGMLMDVDEVPQVRSLAWFISGQFLTFGRSLRVAGGQGVLREPPRKESGRTHLRQRVEL